MKKIISILLVVAFPFLASAQSSALDKIFEKYSGKDGFTTVTLTKAMFDVFSALSTNGDKDLKDITDNLNSIRILSQDGKNNANEGNAFYKEVTRDLFLPDYFELMSINDGAQPVKFLTRKNGDKIAELVMIVGGADACLIALDGEIDLKQVAKLSKSLNLKGFSHLNSASPGPGNN